MLVNTSEAMNVADNSIPDSDASLIKRRVLVVEDDYHLLSGIHDILELDHYEVLTAQNGQAALQLLRRDPQNPPDVIVSDIMMPRMDGFELLEEVRKEDLWVNVPFIFLTAKSERHDEHRGRKMGADVYLMKPFEAEDLLVSVASCLKRQDNIRRVQAEEKKTEQRKMLTMMNHEFRTPLTLVVAYAEMLKDFDPNGKNNDEIKMFLQGVNSGADRLRRLIENFIAIVELENGEASKTFAWRKRPVEDFSLLVEDAHRQVAQPQTRPRNFVFEIDPDLPPVTVDVQFMTIILRELLDNAAKFSKDHATITLLAEAADDHLEIRVRDQGRGIAAHELDQIWEPFYQIEREVYEDQGAGSGLAIVHGLVTLHNGTHEVESTPGEGSTFIIRVPLKHDA